MRKAAAASVGEMHRMVQLRRESMLQEYFVKQIDVAWQCDPLECILSICKPVCIDLDACHGYLHSMASLQSRSDLKFDVTIS